MCMRWPGKIEADTKIDDPVISLDFFPTFVAVGGGEVDPQWALDGVNLLPRLTGAVTELEQRPLYWRQGKERAVRIGNHKLHIADLPGDSERNVFDLGEDIGEATPLKGSDEQVVAALDSALETFEKAMVLPKWGGRRRARARKGK